MKLVHPEINTVFDTEISAVNTLVIENRTFYYSFISQLYEQINGSDGKFVLSEDHTPIAFGKHMEIISSFIPFEINRKTLVTKMMSSLEKTAMDDHFEETSELLGRVEAWLDTLAFDSMSDISFPKLSVGALIKAAAPQFCSDQESLAEKIFDYMSLVREYEGKKLFVTVNLRSFIEDSEIELFMESVLKHGQHLIMLENHEYQLCKSERRVIIDHDLCEIT